MRILDDGSVGGVGHRRVEALHAAAHNAVEHLPDLPLQRLQAVLHGAAHGGELRGGLPHRGLPLSGERDGRRVDRLGEPLRALLERVDFLEEAAGIAPVLALPLLGEPVLERQERRRPRERPARRRGGEVVRLERRGAVRARDGRDERPRGEVQQAPHCVDGRGEARLVRARRGQAGPDGLQLPRRRPGAGHAPRERAEVRGGGGRGRGGGRARRGRAAPAAEGAVAVGGEEGGDAAPAPGGGRVVHEEDREVGQRLPRAAELALVDLVGGEQHGRRDAGEPHPAPDLVNPVAGGVAHVKRLHRALVVLPHQPLRQRASAAAAPRLGHDRPKLLLAQQERLEEPPDPRDGEEILPVPQLREADGHVALERLDLGLPAGREHGGGRRGVPAPGQQRAAEGGERGVGVGGGGALVVRSRHGRR
ncbi:hypothetical protein VPH35_066644 [Triticum aestivum]